LVHIDAVDTLFVYEWRLQQERALRKAKGTGMKDKQVIEFVNGCEYLEMNNYVEETFADLPIYRLSSL
jgi:pantothenate kinase-related protein Tda10